jgi:site-specific recombinase XerD/predicted DNA-binding transcriptional regulator AlpA
LSLFTPQKRRKTVQKLTISEVAKDLGLTRQAIYKYCKQGFIPYKVEYENHKAQYVVLRDEYHEWKRKHFSGVAKSKIGKNHSKQKDFSKEEIKASCLPEWLEWLSAGKLGGKPVGPRTRELYDYYLRFFLDLLPKRPTPPVISVDNYRFALSKIPASKFGSRRQLYDALMSLTKYLIEIQKFTKEDREKLKSLRPKRYLPPKQPCLTEKQYSTLLAKSDSSIGNGDYDRLLNKSLLVFIANTGLRASEVAKLKLKDIDLESRVIYVWLGKMNKNRRVGLTDEALEILEVYLKTRLEIFGDSSSSFFLNGAGGAFNRKTIAQKFKRLSNGLGFTLSPHMLRRYFVTSNVNKGRQLVHLQILCGHSDITTTRSYCRTSEDEVLEMMKDW